MILLRLSVYYEESVICTLFYHQGIKTKKVSQNLSLSGHDFQQNCIILFVH